MFIHTGYSFGVFSNNRVELGANTLIEIGDDREIYNYIRDNVEPNVTRVTRVTTDNFSFPPKAEFENGSITTINSSQYNVSLTSVSSPIVDVYFDIDDFSMTIGYEALLNGESIPTTGLEHVVNFNFEEPIRIRTAGEAAAILNTAGFVSKYNATNATRSPIILCETQGDSQTATTTTVNVSGDLSTVSVCLLYTSPSPRDS